ncbi:TrmO family methyltransferase [Streptomyces sp. NPDC050485]|uniref:TrmO family methyltransferase domain-containing protein n=1 Tax=Streptomyces sp. NPDC050485 TaxID=3365617 RepID=UPI0037893BBF
MSETFETPETYTLPVIGHVVGGHMMKHDDYQGGVESIIRLHQTYPLEAVQGLAEFSHVQVVWRMHLAAPEDVELHARSPRGNPEWPPTGTFVHRNHRRPDQVGISHPNLVRVDGRDVHVTHLDAVHGTPVLVLAPWFPQMGPQGPIHVPKWVDEMLERYWAPSIERAN